MHEIRTLRFLTFAPLTQLSMYLEIDRVVGGFVRGRTLEEKLCKKGLKAPSCL